MKARRASIGSLVALTGLVFFGGCVSADRYKDAVAANDRAQTHLQANQQRLQAALAEQNRLARELDASESMVNNLTQAKAAWENKFNELMVKYMDLVQAGPPTIPDVALPKELDMPLQQWASEYPNEIEYDRARGMVKFKTDLLFAKGSDEISSQAKETLA
ncbi:MAG: hypothetical protein HQ546_10290, partial [Planctomycetes bacterium]|nr:hypothetical protein [Planctomycetota bacterium]